MKGMEKTTDIENENILVDIEHTLWEKKDNWKTFWKIRLSHTFFKI